MNLPMLPFTRKPLTAADQQQITARLVRFQRLPRHGQNRLCVNLLAYNASLEVEIDKQRLARGIRPLVEEEGFRSVTEQRDLLFKQEDLPALFRLLMEENIKFTHEVNVHRRHFDKPTLKTFQE